MEIYKEILSNMLSKKETRVVFDNLEITDADVIVHQESCKYIQKIADILKNDEFSDFDCVEAIVCLLEDLGICTGSRHDFG